MTIALQPGTASRTRPQVGTLPKVDPATRSVREAERAIWVAIRNQEHGTLLNEEAYQRLIELRIARVVAPFRQRSERCGEERRQAVENCNAACAVLGRMRKLLRLLGTSTGTVTATQIRECVELGKVEYRKWVLAKDELPDPGAVDQVAGVVDPDDGEDG